MPSSILHNHRSFKASSILFLWILVFVSRCQGEAEASEKYTRSNITPCSLSAHVRRISAAADTTGEQTTWKLMQRPRQVAVVSVLQCRLPIPKRETQSPVGEKRCRTSTYIYVHMTPRTNSIYTACGLMNRWWCYKIEALQYRDLLSIHCQGYPCKNGSQAWNTSLNQEKGIASERHQIGMRA